MKSVTSVPGYARAAGSRARLPLSQIQLRKGHNPRNWWDDSLSIPIDDLVDYVEARGLAAIDELPELLVEWDGETVHLVAGERRYRAYLQVFGPETPVLVHVVRPESDAERFALAVVENEKLTLTDAQFMHAYRRFRDEWGWEVKDIAQRFGKSMTDVYAKLTISDNPVVAAAYEAGDIGGKTAVKLAKTITKNGSDPVEAVAAAKAEKKDGRKTRYSEPKTARSELEKLIEKYGAYEVKAAFYAMFDDDEPLTVSKSPIIEPF